MEITPFNQPPPKLGNQFDDDRVLRSYLQRVLPTDVHADVLELLRELGELAGGELYRMQLADRRNEPVLTQWDAWGNRIDRIEVSPLWRGAERLAAEFGLVAAAYEGRYGRFDRIVQFALTYLFHPSSDVYTCPAGHDRRGGPYPADIGQPDPDRRSGSPFDFTRPGAPSGPAASG